MRTLGTLNPGDAVGPGRYGELSGPHLRLPFEPQGWIAPGARSQDWRAAYPGPSSRPNRPPAFSEPGRALIGDGSGSRTARVLLIARHKVMGRFMKWGDRTPTVPFASGSVSRAPWSGSASLLGQLPCPARGSRVR